MNKKLLGTIALSVLLFGTITNNVNSKMDVRSVLSEDISETVSGERFAPKKANEVEVKEVANEVKIQQRKNENGTYDIRFVAGINTFEVSKAVFNVTINNGIKTATKSYETKKAYTKIAVGEDVLAAADVFGTGFDYLVAYAISGIPASAIEYTYSVNVSINDENGAIDTSDTRSIILREITDLDLTNKHGEFKWTNGRYVANTNDSIAISKEVTMANGTLSTNMKKSTGAEDSGIIFGVTYSGNELDSYWEGNGVSYYFFFVNVNNCAYLAKSDNGAWMQLGKVPGISGYNADSEYPLSVSFENGYISCFVGEACVIKHKDNNPLTGTQVGFRAQKAGTTYTDLVVSETVKKDSRDVVSGYTVTNGAALEENGTIRTTAGNTILVDERLVAENGKRYTTNYKASVNQDAGIIVGLKDEGYRMFWEEANTSMEYYFFFINSAGILILAKVGSTTNDGVWTTVADNNNIKDFDPSKTYELGAEIEDTVIKCYVDGMLVHTYDTGRSLVGNMFGLRAAVAGAEFSPIEVKEVSGAENIEWYQRSGSFVKDDNGTLTSYCDGSLAWATNREFTKGSIQVDVTASQASDTGIVFGCSDPVGARWEEKPYYFFFVNGGNIALLAGPVNGWTTFKDGGNVSQYMNPYGEANTFKVEVKDNFNIVCYVNGHEVINVTITDSALQLTGTYWGVRCVGQGLRKFENFVITNA